MLPNETNTAFARFAIDRFNNDYLLFFLQNQLKFFFLQVFRQLGFNFGRNVSFFPSSRRIPSGKRERRFRGRQTNVLLLVVVVEFLRSGRWKAVNMRKDTYVVEKRVHIICETKKKAYLVVEKRAYLV